MKCLLWKTVHCMLERYWIWYYVSKSHHSNSSPCIPPVVTVDVTFVICSSPLPLKLPLKPQKLCCFLPLHSESALIMLLFQSLMYFLAAVWHFNWDVRLCSKLWVSSFISTQLTGNSHCFCYIDFWLTLLFPLGFADKWELVILQICFVGFALSLCCRRVLQGVGGGSLLLLQFQLLACRGQWRSLITVWALCITLNLFRESWVLALP